MVSTLIHLVKLISYKYECKQNNDYKVQVFNEACILLTSVFLYSLNGETELQWTIVQWIITGNLFLNMLISLKYGITNFVKVCK